MGWRLILLPVQPEKAAFKMELEIYVGNLSKSTTQEELNNLFAQAGEVTSVKVINDRKSGESNGFAFVTMSAQSEAYKAVSMFNAYVLDDHYLRVNLVQLRKPRVFGTTV
jgi:RNA recognition motif-containing protein